MKLLDDTGLTVQITHLKKYVRAQLKKCVSYFNHDIGGSITIATDNHINASNTGSISLERDNGASLMLSNGSFTVATGNHILTGTPNTLSWDNKKAFSLNDAENLDTAIVPYNDVQIRVWTAVWRIGQLVLVHLNIDIPANITAVDCIGGFPIPLHNVAFNLFKNAQQSLRMCIKTDGKMYIDDSVPTTHNYYNGFVAYFTADSNTINS